MPVKIGENSLKIVQWDEVISKEVQPLKTAINFELINGYF